jgi:hypothetical protein
MIVKSKLDHKNCQDFLEPLKCLKRRNIGTKCQENIQIMSQNWRPKSTKLIITAEQILVLDFKGKGKNNLTALKELDSS